MLHLHRFHRADALADVLGSLFADVPADPFTPEVVAVATRGVERWLTQTLSLRLGVVANVRFPSPRRVVDEAVAAAYDLDADADPWRAEQLLWPLLAVVDEHLEEPWLALLAEHLHDVAPPDVDVPPRLAAVRHLAALFDRYALHRPAMLRAWAAGEDCDGAGRPLPDDARWQAQLWRALRQRIGVDSPPERLPGAVARLTEAPDLVDLPARLAAFNLTRLPPAHLDVLRALAGHRDVHLLVLHPSPALWERVAAAPAPASTLRADDPTVDVPRHRLLASWGRDVRELQLALGDACAHTGAQADVPHERSLLARLQRDVLADEPPSGAAPLDPGDRSVQIHACHGRARQVEVLRDAILHALAADPTLEPRDVIVMCPDIETFAPLIRATFADTEPDLHVRLADRSLRQTNPVLATIARLLELADGRMTASELLDLADRPPVRRRFGLDDDGMSRLEGWIDDAEIRWGLDAPHRAQFQLERVAANTWAAGLDRLMLGVAMTEDPSHLVGGVLPVDDVSSSDIELAGKLAELVARVRDVVERFATPRPLDAWAVEIERAADLLCATTDRDAWQRAELGRLLRDSSPTTPLSLGEVRGLLAERLAGRPTSANFRTGHLTCCTLHPMRSVPHRVVALLGLDDGAFPRATPRDGDDLVLRDPHLGDHDGRTEDRQLLLDALMAAQDTLVVTYTGRDERTNAELPPAVPVGELLDVIEQTAPGARAQIVVGHPLQPFDPRNFAADAPASFDEVSLEGARALTGARAPAPRFLDEPLPAQRTDVIALDDLVRFLQHPARALLRQRLEIRLAEIEEDLDDDLPIELDGLEKWAIGDRLLDARMAGHSMDAAVEAELARGALPPGKLARDAIDEVRRIAEGIADAANAQLSARGLRGAVDARVRLEDGRVLSGTVNGVAGDRLETVIYSRVAAKHRIEAWVRLLALTAAHPGRPFTAVTLGRGRRRHSVVLARLRAVDPPRAQELLEQLVAIMDRGLSEPLPLICNTSAAFAEATHHGTDPRLDVERAWKSDWVRGSRFSREDEQLEHQRVFGGVLGVRRLVAMAPTAFETGPGWDETLRSRFGRLALRVWLALLEHETLDER